MGKNGQCLGGLVLVKKTKMTFPGLKKEDGHLVKKEYMIAKGWPEISVGSRLKAISHLCWVRRT
jgi:hypothetical protein